MATTMINDDFKIEQYKVFTDRQKYFTELARETFNSYMKVVVSLSAGAIALVSTRASLGLQQNLLELLVWSITYLVCFVGIAAAIQIIFCLVRWYHFRYKEYKLIRRSGPPECWAFLFEAMYVFIIFASLFVLWNGAGMILSDNETCHKHKCCSSCDYHHIQKSYR